MSSNPYDPAIAEEVHKRAHAQRGEYLAEMLSLESSIDRVLEAAYEIPEPNTIYLHSIFRFNILARLPLSQRIKALAVVLKSVGVEPTISGRLEKAKTFRNLMAHASPATSAGTFTDEIIYYGQNRNGQRVSVPIKPQDMEARTQEVRDLRNILHRTVIDQVVAKTAELHAQADHLRELMAEPMPVDRALEDLDPDDQPGA
jgi:hypothetical protein